MAEKEKQVEGDLWEQQWWDTPTGFNAFLMYYFPQTPPRSVNAAYRASLPKRKQGSGKKRAPGRWQQWSTATTRDGKKIEGAYTWEERAKAWDDQLARELVEKQRKEIQQLQEGYQRMVKGAFGKLLQAWSQYNPAGNEGLTELTLSTQRLYDVMATVFNFDVQDQVETKPVDPDEIPDLTLTERVDAIASILHSAKARNENGKNGK